VRIEPLLGDTLELTEEVQLGCFALLAKLHEEVLGEVHEHRGGTRVF
jgi:hypothetical protein